MLRNINMIYRHGKLTGGGFAWHHTAIKNAAGSTGK